MNRILSLILAFSLFLLLLSGCARRPLPELPDNAAGFDLGTFTDSEHDDAMFGTIEYDGRTYIAYGTAGEGFSNDEITSCVGYIIQNEHSSSVVDPEDRSRRVYTVSGDPGRNFLMEYDDTVKLMNQPTFYRAVDTKGRPIEIPEWIAPLGYEFWEEG